jgi:8-oxo-dGTP pyrophosphatase MutT (NUDIX family)
MHSVFINNTPLHFINTYNKNELAMAKDHELFSEIDLSVEDLISSIESKNSNRDIYYLSEDADAGWKFFISHYTLIEAAGGLVKKSEDVFLVIFRKDLWDLPKGKIDYDETPEEAAVREIEEECGVTGLSIIKKLPNTFHTYLQKNKRILKKNNWFLMETKFDGPLIPEAREGIEQALWKDKKWIQTVFIQNTYASIAGLLKEFFQSN